MNLIERPSARILLVVWLLLQPPISGGAPLTGAPLAHWVVNGRFPTREQCENTRRINLAALAYAESTGGTNTNGVAARGVITASRCMSDEELRKQLEPAEPD